MARISAQQIRQVVVTADTDLNSDFPPEKLALFNEEGAVLDLVDILERLLVLESEPAVNGIPQGGTTGQILTKSSDADYDATWSEGGDTGGGASLLESWRGDWAYANSYLAGQLVRYDGMLYMAAEDIPEEGFSPYPESTIWTLLSGQGPAEIPPGGLYGQVLSKNSDSDQDVTWANPLSPIPQWTNDTYPVGSLVRYYDSFWAATSEASPLDEPGLVGVYRTDPEDYSSAQIGSGAYNYTAYGIAGGGLARFFFTVTTVGDVAISNAQEATIKVYRPDETVVAEGSDTDFSFTADQLGDYFIVISSGQEGVVRSGTINVTETSAVLEPEPPQTSPWAPYSQDSVAGTGEVLQGPQGVQGPQGPAGEDGVGVPSGGTEGQVLSKASGTDYDTVWEDPPAGGGAQSFTAEHLAEIGPFAADNLVFGPELEFTVGPSGMVLLYASLEYMQPPGSGSPTPLVDGSLIYPSLNTYGNTSYFHYAMWWEGLLSASRTDVVAAVPAMMFHLAPGDHTLQWGMRNNPGGGYARRIRLAALAL